MSLSRRRSARVILSSAEEVAKLPRGERLTVVLAGRLVRYAVLPWSAALGSEDEWLAYARHTLASTYGAAAGWRVRLSRAERGKARVACAIDESLFDALRALPNVVSIQPGLMPEFNARRRELARGRAWLVLEEPERLTLCLIAEGDWKLIRSRRAGADWRAALPDLLARETALSGEPACERVLVVPQAA